MALQDSDNFIIGRGEDSYKITYQDLKDDLNYVPPPVGTIDTPTVTEPNDGAGGGDTRYLKSDAITDVEGGGIKTCETELIESVSSQSTSSLYVMDATPSSLSDVLANGTPYQEGAEIEFGEYLVRVNNEGPITGNVFDANLPVLGLYDAADSTTGCFGEFGTQIPTLAGSYAKTEWTLMELKDEAPNTAAFSYYTFFTDSSVSYQVFRIGAPSNSAGETDSLPALAAGSLTTLTFPSAQGFGCFEPGDVVQGSADSATALIGTWAGSYDDAGSETTLTKGQSYAISGSSTYWFFEDTAPSNLVVQKSDSAANGLYIVGFTTSSEIGNNGTVLYTGDGPFEISFGSTPYVQVYGGGNGESSFQLSSEGDVKVISKDDSDPFTITVDGGEWSAPGDAPADQNQDDVWSQYWNKPIATAERSFDNDLSQQGSHFGTGVAGPVIWNPPNITFTDKVEVYFGGSASKVKYNNDPSFTDINPQTWTTIASGGGTLEQVAVDRDADPVYGWSAIRIDSKVLVNPVGDTKLVKETPYDIKLTVAGSTDLADMTGAVFMSDGAGAPGPYTQTPYKLVTTDIESVDNSLLFSVFVIDQSDGNDPYDKADDFTFVDNYNWTEVVEFTKNSGEIETTFLDFGNTATVVLNKGSADPYFYFSNDGVNYTYCGSVSSPINGATSPGANLIQFTARYAAFYTGGDGTFVDLDKTDKGVTLTFPGAVSSNSDLRYFAAGDVIQTTPGSAGDWAAQTYCSVSVTGSDWYDSQRVYANLWKAAYVGGNAGQCSPAVGKEFTADFSSAGGIPTQGDFYVQADGDWTSGKCLINGESVNEAPWVYETSVTLPKTPDGGDPQVARTNVYRRPGGLENNRLMTVYGQRVSSADAFSSRGFYDDNGWIVDQTFYPSAPAGSDVSVISTGYPDSNTMVVDGGNWKSSDQQPVWSSTEYCVSGAEGNGIYSSDRAFSGELVGEELWYAPKGGDVARFETGDLFNDASVLQICYARSGSGQFLLNDQPLALGAGDEQLHTEILTSGFQSLQFDYPSNGNYCALLWIKIDGVLLQDGSGGDDHVEYQTKGGEGTIISTDPDTNTLVIADTGDRDNRWIKGFFVAGPSVIDTPLLTNDVELRASDFATTPPGSDTLKEIIWDINGVEYSAGVTNPWSPLEKLPTNSTVTVKVKYKGNTLEDSDWSPDVTFTTGASIRSLFTRIAALEANDVTDDATDTALLTLIAGLAARIQALEESN